MKNLIWILGGFAAGYYLAKKMQAPTNGTKLPSGGGAIPNAGLAPSPGVGACPNDQRWPYRYVNCNSQFEANQVL